MNASTKISATLAASVAVLSSSSRAEWLPNFGWPLKFDDRMIRELFTATTAVVKSGDKWQWIRWRDRDRKTTQTFNIDLEDQHYANADVVLDYPGFFRVNWHCENGKPGSTNNGLYMLHFMGANGEVLAFSSTECHLGRDFFDLEHKRVDGARQGIDLTEGKLEKVTSLVMTARSIASVPTYRDPGPPARPGPVGGMSLPPLMPGPGRPTVESGPSGFPGPPLAPSAPKDFPPNVNQDPYHPNWYPR